MSHQHVLKWEDVFAGRAEVLIRPESLLELAKLAGAPWNDTDPDAQLSDLQKEIITSPERTVVVFGGSRGGKSVSAGVMGLGGMMIPNFKIGLVGGNYEHCSKEFAYMWKGFFNLFPKSAAVERKFIAAKPIFSMRIVTAWGSEVSVYSTNSKEGQQILGNEFDMIILCEAAQVQAEIFTNKIERALLGRAKRKTGSNYLRRTGRAILLTTPKEQGGASYDVYSRAMTRTKGRLDQLRLSHLERSGVDSATAWFDSLYFVRANVRELNPTYPIEAFEHARRTLPKHDFEQQFLGMASVRSGLAYSSYREEVHAISKEKLPSPEVLRRSTLGVGIDTGNNFAAILAALTPEGKAYILGEVFEVGQNTRQNADAIQNMLDKALGHIFPVTKEAISLWVVDVNSHNILDLEEQLEITFYCQKYDVVDTIGTLDVKMGAGELLISDECDFLLHEIRNLRWKKLDTTKTTPKRDNTVGADHCLDAMRYLLMQLFEMGPPKDAPAAFTVDQMLEKERNELLTCNLSRDLERMQRGQNQNFLEALW